MEGFDFSQEDIRVLIFCGMLFLTPSTCSLVTMGTSNLMNNSNHWIVMGIVSSN